MLASQLIARFVGQTATPSRSYMGLYCEHYAPGVAPAALPQTAPPPGASVTHAATLAKTLGEWAARLDAAGVQVHQEGATARFASVAQAPAFGRHPGAVASRAKTAAFFAAVIETAVGASRARSYEIPAASWQGASVALTEAAASAAAFHAAVVAAAWPSTEERPELAAARAQDEATRAQAIGRAVAMHTTALAEAIGALRVAEGGDWLFIATDPAQLPPADAGLLVGVEVQATSPLLRALVANLDPQHGGGTFGLGCQPAGRAACTAAIEVVRALGAPLPRSTRYVTTRLDPDSLVAAMILSGRVPLEMAEASAALADLAELDDSSASPAPWRPGRQGPQAVADDFAWGPVGAMCLAASRPGGPTLPQLEAAVIAALTGLTPDEQGLCPASYADAYEAHEAAMAAAGALKATPIGGVPFGVDWPIGPGGWMRAYETAPVAVLAHERFPFRGGAPGRKYTIGTHRGCPRARDFHIALRARLGAGWGGGETITGSPMSGPCPLTHEQVAAAVAGAAAEVGITLPTAAGSGGSSVARLR